MAGLGNEVCLATVDFLLEHLEAARPFSARCLERNQSRLAKEHEGQQHLWNGWKRYFSCWNVVITLHLNILLIIFFLILQLSS